MKPCLYCCFFLAIFMNGGLPLRAQEPSFINYGVDDGLPSNLVYSMAQDRDGFLWFATDKGLARFDGHRFKVIGMDEGLPDKEVFKITPDSKGRLWMSPFQQNPCYWENGKIVTAASDPLLNQMNFAGSGIDFQEGADGRLWLFGTVRFAYVVEGDNARLLNFSDCPRKIFFDGPTTYYFGNDRITLMEPDGSQQILLEFDKALGIHDSPARFEGIDFSNNLILYSRSGTLMLLKYSAGSFRILDSRKDIYGGVVAEDQGTFWVCNNGKGAFFVDCSSGKIVLKNQVLHGKKVNYMIRDNQNTRWFCTLDEGVFGLPINTAKSYVEDKYLTSGNISSLAVSNRYGVMAGDDEGNVYTFDNNLVQQFHPGSRQGYNRILKIVTPPNDSLYIASDRAIFCYGENGFDGPSVEAITISAPKSIIYHDGKLWSGSASYIGHFSHNYSNFQRYSAKRFTAVCADSDGVIWGGGIFGLYSVIDSFTYNWGLTFKELASRIITMEPASPGQIWVVTALHDLLRVSVEKGRVLGVEVMNKQLKSPVQNIKALFVDAKSNLWMGTNHGVYMLRPDLTILHYDKHDGIADDDINTLLVDKDTLWVGTTKGITQMHLGRDDSRSSFPTFVTEVSYQVENRLVSMPFFGAAGQGQRIQVPAYGGLVEILLAGLDYASRGNIQFECISYEAFPPLGSLTFGNLLSLLFRRSTQDTSLLAENSLNLGVRVRPGKYVYQFAAINTRGKRSDSPDTLVLVQQPYWYETCWFWLAFWAFLFWVLRKVYQNRIAYRDLYASVAKLRLQALQAQMNPHFIGNSIYAIQQFFYPPNPEKASEYIELFNRLLRQSMMMSERHFVHFLEDIRYYEDYLTMIKLRFGERFSFQFSGTDAIPADTPFPAMILQPILENATIHGLAPEGISMLQVSFDQNGNRVICTIEDNGEGIETTRENAKRKNIQRQSKGLEILDQKISTMNRLYQIDAQLLTTDMRHDVPTRRGTRTMFSFDYTKISKHELLTENPDEKN